MDEMCQYVESRVKVLISDGESKSNMKTDLEKTCYALQNELVSSDKILVFEYLFIYLFLSFFIYFFFLIKCK